MSRTTKPRLIPLHPVVVKLLRLIQKRGSSPPCLREGSLDLHPELAGPRRELVSHLQELGVPLDHGKQAQQELSALPFAGEFGEVAQLARQENAFRKRKRVDWHAQGSVVPLD